LVVNIISVFVCRVDVATRACGLTFQDFSRRW